jgi:dTDP-4-dehydrorhamnose reductase
MLGQDLAASLQGRHEVVALARADLDITDAPRVEEAIARARPGAVVHCAAFTAVDDCESQPDLAFRVNAQGARNVALACREAGAGMVYPSTDYVFDGEKASPYLESDEPNPINVYGRSKLEGEQHVRELLERFWIVRVSWLFGPLGKNFVRAILERAGRGIPLRVVDDQVGAPTYTMDAAEKIEPIVERGAPGIYHVTNQGACSWFEFATEIMRQASPPGGSLERLARVPLERISTAELGRPAARPRNSRLANTRLEAEGFGLLPPWQDALRRYLLRAGPSC